MPKIDTLEYAVSQSLQHAALMERDHSTADLARRYARLIDEAAVPAKYAESLRHLARALTLLVTLGEDTEQADAAYRKMVIALSEHSVISDLGPKLLAALTALGMTPASRSLRGGGHDAAARPAVAVALDEFTARRTGQHPA